MLAPLLALAMLAAPPAAPDLQALARGCDAVDDATALTQLRAVGQPAQGARRVIEAREGELQLALVLDDDDGAPRCRVYLAKPPKRGLKGVFTASGKRSVVAVAQGTECESDDTCDYALMVWEGRTLVDALPLPSGCTLSVVPKALKLFGGRIRSLEVRCQSTTGAGYDAERVLVHGLPLGLAVVHQARMGWASMATQEERREGGCDARPVGWLKVLSRGDRPVIAQLEPYSEAMEDGRGQAQPRELTWAPKQRRFVETRRRRAVTFDAFHRCRKHR